MDRIYRFGLELWGSEGIISIRSGGVFLYPAPVFIPGADAPSWEPMVVPEEDRKPDGTPCPPEEKPYLAHQRLVYDLIPAVEESREPYSSGADGRASLEMILAVYESQLAGGRVPFPLAERTHPLTRWPHRRYLRATKPVPPLAKGGPGGYSHAHQVKPWRPEAPLPLLTKEGMEGRFRGVRGRL